MRIKQPYSLNEIGGRSNNEDSVFPEKGKANENNPFFLVCDGIGGHQNGEVASNSICQSFGKFLKPFDPNDFNEAVFQQALKNAYAELDAKDNIPGEGKKMGTTLTFLYLNDKAAFMAHIGDSRIYHIRKEGGTASIVYKSPDHSLVNDLLRANIITPEEAEHHPKKNVITRAIQPHQEQRSKAEIHQTSDVKAGDYFFLCSDGILEQINDDRLCAIIAKDSGDREKITEIRYACQGHSKDNFSAYLIPVDEGITIPAAIAPDIIIAENSETTEISKESTILPQNNRLKRLFNRLSKNKS
jgi:protein phosphatase